MTTLTTVGQSIVTGLNSESDNRYNSSDVINIPIGIASTSTSQYQLVAKELDLQMLDVIQANVDLINQKKQQIVGLCAQGIAGYVSGYSLPTCSLESDTGNLSSVITSETDSYPAASAGTGGLSGVGGTPTPQIAYGVVRDDQVRIRRYPYLEDRISPNDNALENLKFPILSTGKVGQGKENLFFQNSKYNDGTLTYYVTDDDGSWNDENWSGSGNVIGNYYKITGPGSGYVSIAGTFNQITQTFSPDSTFAGIVTAYTGITTGTFQSISVSWDPSTQEMLPLNIFQSIPNGGGNFITTSSTGCNAIASQITTLEGEIDALRVGLTTWFDSINTVKRRKHSYQLRIWSYKRIQARNSAEQVNIGIGTSAVYAIDPELPTSSNTFDDNILTTFDTTTLTFDNA